MAAYCENLELNSNEGCNQEFDVGTELSTTPWTENNTNDDQNQMEIMEYNVEMIIALFHVHGTLQNL